MVKISERTKGFITGVLVVLLLFAGIPAIAASVQKTITVTYDKIKFYADGTLVTPKDDNGKTVEPFIFEGSAYLPVSAVGKAIGKPVTWKGEENAIYIGAVPGETQDWFDECSPYQYNGYHQIFDGTNASKTFKMSGVKYTKGFILDDRGGTTEAMFNLDGKYKTLNVTIGHVDGTPNESVKMYIYLDGKLSKEFDVLYDDVAKKVEIPLNKALQMKIVMDNYNYNINRGNYTQYGFVNGEWK